MFERPDSGERATLVHVELNDAGLTPDLDEFIELVRSAGADIADVVTVRRDRPDPRAFIGSGKLETLKATAADTDVIIFNNALSPGQERNIERETDRRVMDRTRLILDIFAQRARSFEGKLQVELAQLNHMRTRLVRGWSHLERQKGGIGLRGPGETQLETDRRLIGDRIKQINERLERVRRQRHLGARARRRADLSTVSIVGYTNAGKSTLFNRLTAGGAYAADQLFATLDTTLRRLDVPGENPVLVGDTVGFIRDIPPELIAAFQATLEETKDAALLLHVVDASADDRDQRVQDVETVLERIGAGETPMIEVFNKIDRIADAAPRVERDASGRVRRVWLSARDDQGIGGLIDAIAEHVNRRKATRRVGLPPEAGRLRARLYDMGAVIDEVANDSGGWSLEIVVDDARWKALKSAESINGIIEFAPFDPVDGSAPDHIGPDDAALPEDLHETTP